MPFNFTPPLNTRQGIDHNYYTSTNVTWTAFGGSNISPLNPDLLITFTTQGVLFLNEGSNPIQISFNGSTVHDLLTPGTPSQGIAYDSRVISLIWVAAPSGSSILSVRAWATT